MPARGLQRAAQVALGEEVVGVERAAVPGGTLRAARRVEEQQDTVGGGHAGPFAQRGGRVREVVEQPRGEDAVHGRAGQRQPGAVGGQEVPVAGAAVPGRGGQHGRGEVDAEHVPAGADLRPERGHGPSGTAAEVHRTRTRCQSQPGGRGLVGGGLVGEPLLPGVGPAGEEGPGGGVFGAGRHEGREPAEELLPPGVQAELLRQEADAPGAGADPERLLGVPVAGGQYDGVGGQFEGVAGRSQAGGGPGGPGEQRVGTGGAGEFHRRSVGGGVGQGPRGVARRPYEQSRTGFQGQYGYFRGEGFPQERRIGGAQDDQALHPGEAGGRGGVVRERHGPGGQTRGGEHPAHGGGRPPGLLLHDDYRHTSVLTFELVWLFRAVSAQACPHGGRMCQRRSGP